MARKSGTYRHSEESKELIRQAQKKVWSDPEYRAKRTAEAKERGWAGGRYDPEENSKALKSRWADPEWKKMMVERQREGAKKRWADPEKRAAALKARGIDTK